MSNVNPVCLQILEEHGQRGPGAHLACSRCSLEIERCDCGRPMAFEAEPYPKGCPLAAELREIKPDEYDVCDKCGAHVCPNCQDNEKVGYGVFDSLCKDCGRGMSESEYKRDD